MIIFIVIVSLSVLILVHELGHFLAAKIFGVKVEEFGFGFPPRLFSKKIGETVYSVNLLPFGGFVKIYGEDGKRGTAMLPSKTAVVSPQRGETQLDSQPRSPFGHPARSASETFSQTTSPSLGVGFSDKPVWQRSVMVLAGIFMNIVLAWLVLSSVFMVGVPEHLVIADVTTGSPAEIAGIGRGDIILEASYADVVLRDPVKSEELINLVNKAAGSETRLKLQRGSDVFEIFVVGRPAPPAGQGPLGVVLVNAGLPPESFINGLIKGAAATWFTLKAIVVAFVNFFATVFVDSRALETIAGPVGIFVIVSQVGSLGIVYLLQSVALISLNLAVLNLIPFPALDGGRFLFLLFEKIKGSPVSPRLQMVINSFGFAVLIVLMILVTFRDVSRLITG